jgi:tripartite ATP-independent transporter DctP family solute receptor
MKRFSLILLVAVMVLSIVLSGCGGTTTPTTAAPTTAAPATTSPLDGFEKQVLQMGTTITPVNGKHIHWQTMEFLAEEISKETNGLIELELYPSGQLGGERDFLEGISLGTFKIGLPFSIVGTVSDVFNVYDMPYLIKDMDHFVKVAKSDLTKEMGKTLESSNLKLLGMGSASGPYHISNNTRSIKTVEDIKGLKIRAMESPFILDGINALGAQAVPMAWPEVYTALQQNTIDGVCTINTGYWSAKLYEVQDYVSELGMFYSPAYVIVNLEWFNSLPVELQEAVQRGVDAALERHYVDCVEQDEVIKQELKNLGMVYTEVEEIDVEAFREAVRTVYEKYEEKYGDLIRDIQALGD